MIDGLLADPTRRQQTVAFRRISKIPYKVLDAPGMEDEFYANLLDWSSFNIISIVLDGIVYLVSLSTGQVNIINYTSSFKTNVHTIVGKSCNNRIKVILSIIWTNQLSTSYWVERWTADSSRQFTKPNNTYVAFSSRNSNEYSME